MVWWKFGIFFMSFSKPQVISSSNFASLFNVMKDNSSEVVKYLILCTIGANESVSFGDLRVLGSNYTKFLSFLKQKISFSSNFASIFRVMSITPLYFLAKIVYTLRSLSKYKFGEILHEQWKVWNFALWWAPFVQIMYNFS